MSIGNEFTITGLSPTPSGRRQALWRQARTMKNPAFPLPLDGGG